ADGADQLDAIRGRDWPEALVDDGGGWPSREVRHLQARGDDEEAGIGGGELAQQGAQPVVLEAAGEARVAAAARAARGAVLQRLQAVEDDERALGRDQLRQPHALVVLGLRRLA